MAGPKLRLLFEGELVAEVPFLGAPIRIGRLKGNDVVINNLSTSRFHATLTEQGGTFFLEDLGSENGSWVNGRKVTTCKVGPGDQVQIGKHDLVIVPAQGAAEAPPSAEPLVELTEAEPELTDPIPGQALNDAPAPDFSPLESDAELAAPDELIEDFPAPLAPMAPAAPAPAHDLAEFDVSETDLQDPTAEEPLAIEAPTALLDADETPRDANDATHVRAPEDPAGLLEAIEPEPEPAVEPERLHAGIILQREGRLERVIQWELDRMTLGRAVECEIVLATPEISRRHALLVRNGEHYEVRDLESINGTYVNGEKVTRRALASGDVIKIEDFEMTFVIDRGPISEHVKTAARPTADAKLAGGADPGVTQFGEMMDLAPFVAEESDENDANAMSFDNLGAPLEDGELPPIPMPGMAAAPAEEPELETDPEPAHALAAEPEPEPVPDPDPASDSLEMPEGVDLPEGLDMPESLEMDDAPRDPEPDTVLLSDEDVGSEEKDLVEAPREARTLRLELRIRLEELPPALRAALSALDPADLRLPVELRLATED